MSAEKLGSILIRRNKLRPGDLSMCLAVQKAQGGGRRLGRILIEQHLSREEDVARAVAEQSGWPYYDGDWSVDQESLSVLGEDFFRKRKIFPARNSARRFFVLADTLQTGLTDELRALCGPQISFMVAAPRALERALQLLRTSSGSGASPEPEGSDSGDDDPVARILIEAVGAGATDIHVEPSLSSFESRLRIDGVLHFHRSWPLGEHPFFVNRVFRRAGISAGDFLRFHDARFEFETRGRTVDVRVSHLPSLNGSALVLRLLERGREAMSMEHLGYSPEHQKVLERILRRPHGLALITGPTGCGKTTGLHAMIGRIKNSEVKIVSVEDPVEVRASCVTQVSVDSAKGYDFPDVTRALLRHDPDIVLVGEIRDEKTAREAVRAAETGHRVFSTLHTNSATGAFLRLRDLGVDWAHLAATLNCVIAQRLVRKLCPECRKEGDVGSIFPGAEGYLLHGNSKFYVPRGCPSCRGGFSGRTVVAEIFCIEEEDRFLIEQGLMSELVPRQAARAGFVSMRADACRLVTEGVLSLCEAVRVLG